MNSISRRLERIDSIRGDGGGRLQKSELLKFKGLGIPYGLMKLRRLRYVLMIGPLREGGTSEAGPRDPWGALGNLSEP